MNDRDRVDPNGAEAAADADRHATNLELFLDLVFVFAVTQIATMIGENLTVAGVGRALLIAGLVWWQWSQYTWAGSAVDLQAGPITRVLVLATIPVTLTMAVAIPEAFGDTGLWFGCAYLGVQLLVLGMQGAEALRHASTRPAFIRYGSIASLSPVFVVVGGLFEGRARIWIWVAAAVVNTIGALRAASGEWVINPVHFAERHALFVIISLGEALVAIGAAATGAGLTATTFAGLAVAAGLACVLWWTYFAFIPGVAEHQLRGVGGAVRGLRARNLFTFGHFPIIGGLIYFAVAVKHMVPHATDPLASADRWLLILGIALLIGGYLHIQWRVVHRLAVERPLAVVAVLVWCRLASDLGGVWVVGVVAVILAAMQSVTWRRFRAGALAHVTPNR